MGPDRPIRWTRASRWRSEAAQLLINCNVDTVDDATITSLRSLGAAAGAHNARVFRVDDDGLAMSTHE